MKSKSGKLKERITKIPADYGIDANHLADTFANFNDRYASINKHFLTPKIVSRPSRPLLKTSYKTSKNDELKKNEFRCAQEAM